jgi:hypothetical protein
VSTPQLAVFNRALGAMGERALSNVAEPREPARVLLSFWPDCVQFCLEAGLWNFALRSATLTSSGGSALNYSNAFNKPADFVHLFTASLSPSLDPPLVNDYVDQGAQFFANGANLYIRYSSNDPSAGGGNLSLWTTSFSTYVAYVLAAWSAFRLTGNIALADSLDRRSGDYLLRALAIDSVAALPGLRPFNAEARALVVEGHQPQPIDIAPFYAAIAQPETAGADRAGGRQ